MIDELLSFEVSLYHFFSVTVKSSLQIVHEQLCDISIMEFWIGKTGMGNWKQITSCLLHAHVCNLSKIHYVVHVNFPEKIQIV